MTLDEAMTLLAEARIEIVLLENLLRRELDRPKRDEVVERINKAMDAYRAAWLRGEAP